MTEEGKIKAQIKKLLNAYNAYYEMPVPGGFGKSGLDFNVCMNGFWLAIEAKKPGGKPTPRQIKTMEDIRKAGGATMLIDGIDTMLELEAWLKLMSPIKASGMVKALVQKTQSMQKQKDKPENRKKYEH